jgi:hypothetical protein
MYTAEQVKPVLDFLRDLAHGKQACELIKLSIVGRMEAGKSSLLDALQACSANHGVAQKLKGRKPDDRTDGIDIKWWRPVQGEGMMFCAWDYAGQIVYYATHQFFVSHRAMILLVCRLTAYNEEELLAWVESLQSRAPGSKLLLVGTHLDECAQKGVDADDVLERAEGAVKSWEEEQLRRLDGMIEAARAAVDEEEAASGGAEGHNRADERSASKQRLAELQQQRTRRPKVLRRFAVSSTSGAGIAELLDGIVAARSSIEEYGEDVPRNYMQLVRELRKAQERRAEHKGEHGDLQTRQKLYGVRWQPNDSSASCTQCHATFGVFTRRHHCRACGALVCSACSKSSKALQYVDADGSVALAKKARVCGVCAKTSKGSDVIDTRNDTKQEEQHQEDDDENKSGEEEEQSWQQQWERNPDSIATKLYDEQLLPRLQSELMSDSSGDYVTLAHLQQLVAPCGFRDHEHLLRAVEFAHRLGVMHYYGEKSEYIFLRPQWLVDVMSRLVSSEPIQAKRLGAFVSEGKDWMAYGKPQREADRERFVKEAVVTQRLLSECLWAEYDKLLHPDLLNLAQHFELLVRVPTQAAARNAADSGCSGSGSGDSNDDGDECFLVPWLLHELKTSALLADHLGTRMWTPAEAHAQCRRRRFEFALGAAKGVGGIPAGFFSRLQARLYREYDELLPECTKDAMLLTARRGNAQSGEEIVAVMVRPRARALALNQAGRSKDKNDERSEEDEVQLPGLTQYGVIDVVAWYSGAVPTAIASASTFVGSHEWQLCGQVLKSIRLLQQEWQGLVTIESVPCPHCCESHGGFISLVMAVQSRETDGTDATCRCNQKRCRQSSTVADLLLPLHIRVNNSPGLNQQHHRHHDTLPNESMAKAAVKAAVTASAAVLAKVPVVGAVLQGLSAVCKAETTDES